MIVSTLTSFSAVVILDLSYIHSEINLFELNQLGQQPQNIVLKRWYFLLFPNTVGREVEHAKITVNVLLQCTTVRMTISTCYNNLRASLEDTTAITGSTNS